MLKSKISIKKREKLFRNVCAILKDKPFIQPYEERNLSEIIRMGGMYFKPISQLFMFKSKETSFLSDSAFIESKRWPDLLTSGLTIIKSELDKNWDAKCELVTYIGYLDDFERKIYYKYLERFYNVNSNNIQINNSYEGEFKWDYIMRKINTKEDLKEVIDNYYDTLIQMDEISTLINKEIEEKVSSIRKEYNHKKYELKKVRDEGLDNLIRDILTKSST